MDIDAGTGSIDIDCTGGVISLDNDGAGKDITLTSDAGRIVVTGEEAATDAIQFISAAGGLDSDTALSTHITSSEETGDAIYIHASGTAGGVDITSGTGDIALVSTDDITLTTATGAGDRISLLNSNGTADDAISLASTAGGITLNSAAGSIDIEAVGAGDGDIILKLPSATVLASFQRRTKRDCTH